MLFSCAEAARLYRMSERTMRHWIAASQLVNHGRTHRPRYRWADLDALVADHRPPAPRWNSQL